MAKIGVKLAWALVALWLLGCVITWQSYRSVAATSQQIHELSRGIKDLRSSFEFETPFHNQVIDTQSLNLQLIYALRLQIEANYPASSIMPDVSQLMYTADRFIDQVQSYIDNELSLISLVDGISRSREHYLSTNGAHLYNQLSTAIFEAMYGANGTSPKIYRSLDNIYLEAEKLSNEQEEDLKTLLVQASAVLGSYAQGRHIVENLVNHDVYAQIELQRAAFHQVRERHILTMFVLTLIVLVSLLSIVVRIAKVPAVTRVEPTEVEPATHNEEPEVQAVQVEDGAKATPLSVTVSPSVREINISTMLDSLNGDVESVCMLLEVFVDDHSEDINKIETLLSDSPDEAQRTAHSLKGVGGNLGAEKLRQAASDVELAIGQDISRVPELLSVLQSRLEKAIEESNNYLKQYREEQDTA